MLHAMTLAAAIASLYALSGFAACACYGPQLRRLVKSAEARRAMSLASWGGWLGLGGIGLLYAAMMGTPEMVLVNGLNAACQVVVVALVLGQRLVDAKACRHEKGRLLAAPAPSISP